MSSDPPPPYPGGPNAPLLEEKNGQPPVSGKYLNIFLFSYDILNEPLQPFNRPLQFHGTRFFPFMFHLSTATYVKCCNNNNINNISNNNYCY